MVSVRICTRYKLPGKVFVHLPERYASTGDNSIYAPSLLPSWQKVFGRLMDTAHLVRCTSSFWENPRVTVCSNFGISLLCVAWTNFCVVIAIQGLPKPALFKTVFIIENIRINRLKVLVTIFFKHVFCFHIFEELLLTLLMATFGDLPCWFRIKTTLKFLGNCDCCRFSNLYHLFSSGSRGLW